MPDHQITNHARAINRWALLALAAMCTAQARAEDPWAGPYAGVTAVASRSVISGATTRADGTVGGNSQAESAQNLRDSASGLGVHMGFRKRLESGLIGGLAFSSEKATRTQYQANGVTNLTEVRFSETDRQNRIGHALGAGAQWRLGRVWSLRAEYLHTRFRDETFRFPDARGGAQGSYTSVQGRLANNGLHMNAVRVGVTYAFGQGR